LDQTPNVYWFAYYRYANLISMDEIENGLVWRRVPEAPHGFLTRPDAVAWLEMISNDKLIVHESYTVSRRCVTHDEAILRLETKPEYLYTIRPMGIVYVEGSAPDTGSAWHLGVLREINGLPRPESMVPPKRSRFRVKFESGVGAGGEYVVEF
jgi:hypothetical protein